MADNSVTETPASSSEPTRIISNIIDSVLDLSSVLNAAPQTQAQTSSSSASPGSGNWVRPTEVTREICDAEIQRVFRPRQSTGSQSNIRPQQSQSHQSYRGFRQLRLQQFSGNPAAFRPGSSVMQRAPAPFLSNLNHCQRGIRSKGNASRKDKARSGTLQPTGLLTVDFLLLPDANYDVVPKQAPKVLLIEHGHYIIGVQFRKEWTAIEVMQKIRESYQSIIPAAVEVQLCTSVNTKIIKPSIAPGQTLNGFIMHRIFKNKTVYVRPNATLLDLNDEPEPADKIFKEDDSDDEEADLPPFDLKVYSVKANEATTSNEAVVHEESLKQADGKMYESLADELDAISAAMHINDECTEINVRRRRLWDDTMKKISIFNDLKKPNVKFVGEDAADYGGPTREFYSILLSTAPVLCGPQDNKTFVRDAVRLEENEYASFGKIVALSLLHGCPGPHNFCCTLAKNILRSEENEYSIDDIPDYDVKERVQQLLECKTEAEFSEKQWEIHDIRFEAGYNKPIIRLSDKEEIIRKICKHYIISKQLEEIQQFESGLSSFGVLDVLRRHKDDAFKELTYNAKSLTAGKIRDLYSVLHSENQALKEQEEDIVFNFFNFLDELENGAENSKFTFAVTVLGDEGVQGTKQVAISLEDVLQFLTGSRHISCHGLKKGEIAFFSSPDRCRRVHINTCGIGISFPLNERYAGKNFTANFSDDILCAPGFGKV